VRIVRGIVAIHADRRLEAARQPPHELENLPLCSALLEVRDEQQHLMGTDDGPVHGSV
jgi:hypothetical protein